MSGSTLYGAFVDIHGGEESGVRSTLVTIAGCCNRICKSSILVHLMYPFLITGLL